MKWILVTSCVCILSLLAVGRALPIRRSTSSSRSARHPRYHDELGDIVLFPHQEQILEEYRKGTTKRAVADKDLISPWSNGVVPYVMDPKIAGTKFERSFNKAMDIWQKYTCIKFVNRTNQKFYVKFTNSTLCNSNVGKPTDEMPSYEVRLGPECDSPGNAMHELGHVLGFFHEHQRPDRDQYIIINEDGIQDSQVAEDAYRRYDGYVNSLGVEYDYASIMHYSKRAFAKPGEVAFKINKSKKLPECLPEVGQRKSISRKDIDQINKLYNCPAKKILENLDDCALFNPSQTEIRKKNIKTTNLISLGLEEENTWVTCRTGRCFKKECKANNLDKRRKRNTFTTLQDVCDNHQFTLRTTITRAKSDKVKVGDNITLEWKPGKFLDCSSVSGACSMTQCSQMDVEGSNGAEECPNHIFRIASETKEVGDIVQTYDEIQLEYVRNGYFVDCNGAKCVVQPYQGCTAPSRANDEGQEVTKDQVPEDQVNCKPPSFVIRK